MRDEAEHSRKRRLSPEYLEQQKAWNKALRDRNASDPSRLASDYNDPNVQEPRP